MIRFSCRTLCGIPEVTLLGTVADWTDVHTRFLVLADTWMHCNPETSGWVKDVDAFLKQFIAARSGKVWQARCRSDSLASSTSFLQATLMRPGGSRCLPTMALAAAAAARM